MTLLNENGSMSPPDSRSSAAVRLVAAAPSLWRVLDRAGRVIGHLQEHAESDDVRYLARRYHPTAHVFRDLGAFWSVDDALECLRYAR